jgi:hypothetical protein
LSVVQTKAVTALQHGLPVLVREERRHGQEGDQRGHLYVGCFVMGDAPQSHRVDHEQRR